jgi:DNA-binding NtrC family response regulator
VTEATSRRGTILIVAGDVVVRNLVLRVLVCENYRVFETGSCMDALKVSKTFDGAIDLLIFDDAEESMAVRQMAEQIRRSRHGIKVLDIAGDLLKVSEPKRASAMAGDFASNAAFTPAALAEKVNRILST